MLLRTLCIFGTRPEAIKMAPIIQQLKNHPQFDNKICVTGQHLQMLRSVLELFSISPDFNLEVMTANQDLSHLMAKILTGLSQVFEQFQPQLVLVHGDTTTTLAASLSAYYHHVPIAHVEAGLRTGNIYAPWPEEANRKLTGSLATVHFAPTSQSRFNLLQEGIASESIFVTGNTVIDALYDMVKRIEKTPELASKLSDNFPFLSENRKMILVTGHRRENFGQGFEQICQALLEIAQGYPEVDILYPVHLNPHVQQKVNSLLTDVQNIYLIPPVDYLSFVHLMKTAYFILTDSGGIQEEATALGKPILVMREATERPEAVDVGIAKLVGTDVEKIVSNVSLLLNDPAYYKKMSEAQHPYGNGKAARNIIQVIFQLLAGNDELLYVKSPNDSMEGNNLDKR